MYYVELEPSLFRLCFWEDDDDACRELAEGFWDRQYLRKLGLLPSIPPPTFPEPQWEDPTPTPMLESNLVASLVNQLRIHEHVLLGLLNIAAGDPSPQPSVVGLLLEPNHRIEAAKNLSRKLGKALEELNAEIGRLENLDQQSGG